MKKDQYKFTIRFNPDDPRQREAADILNGQKARNKASYLTNVILGGTPPATKEIHTEQKDSYELDDKTAQSINDALNLFG